VSAVYLYAITDSGRAAQVPEGLHFLPVDGIGGVYGSAPEGELRATEANLWEHEAVVEALMHDGAVLPARFGTVLESIDRLRDELVGRQEEFARALDRVRGRVELGVRAVWPERAAVGAPADSGRVYLARKLGEQRAAADATSSVHEPLARLAVASALRVEHSPCLTVIASYLVDRGEVASFRSEADRLARTLDGVTLACTGPWPPYSFTDEEERSEH
jgi:Gas vesicle synthesis protein GvpL/GvpF